MNSKEWKNLSSVDCRTAYYYYNLARAKLLSREFESLESCDKDAKVIHHLRDTEEQRKYNDEHYELWGFEIDENGNEHFEYGKYVVFWTKEHHSEYHSASEEIRLKRRRYMIALWSREDYRNKMNKIHSSEEHRRKLSVAHKGKIPHNKGKTISEDTRRKISESNKGKSPSNKGVKMSDDQKNKLKDSLSKYWSSNEAREKASIIQKELWSNEEHRKKMSNAHKGKKHSEETRKKMSESQKKVERGPLSEEHKQSLREHHADFSGENHPFYGKHHSNESREKMIAIQKD